MSDVDPSGRNAGDDAPSEAPSSNAGDNAPFDAMAFMSNFDPGLIHRVLLTEPSDYSNLTMSGQPRLDRTPAFDANFLYDNGFTDTTTPTLGEGVDGNEPNVSSQISRTMKKAFHDALVASLLHAATQAEGAREEGPEQDSPPPNTSDLSAIIIDLREKMRQMIPNRTDLHGTLSDEEVKSIQLGGRDVLSAYLPHLIRSAEALIQLESEDRSVTTRQWLEMASSAVAAVPSPPALPLDIPSPEIFVVSSLSYLHLKADLCGSDIANYHLSTVLAPQIALHGPEYERFVFQQRFGPFGEEGTAPITRQWIERTIQECGMSREELRSSEERRVTALQTSGWVNLILFQTRGEVDNEEEEGGSGADSDGINPEGEGTGEQEPQQQPQPQPFILVPEVLLSDVANLRSIRSTTRMSVIGSALALHACTVAGVGDAVLRREPSTSEINQCRDDLIEAMSGRDVSSQLAFEEDISSVVIALARVLKPSLGAEEEKVLKSLTPTVMKGEDPVVKLLHNRMRIIFCELMEWTPEHSQTIPNQMSTGRRMSSLPSSSSGPAPIVSASISDLFLAEAKQRFMTRGFAFFSAELADVCLKATKVISLAFIVYGKDLMEPTMKKAL